jgi:type 1 glutamine amidotransferase/HEAT repeat protein
MAAPLPHDLREAVQQVRASDGVQPRPPLYLLEQAVPRAAGDAEQRQELAKLLAETVTAAGTTPAARTVLCQHLAKVAGEAEAPLLRKLLADPATAADARIALGDVVGAPATAEPVDVYLAGAGDPKPATRVASLSALAHFYPREALPVCVKALRDADPAVGATAVQQLGRLDGAALARELPALDAPRQVLALEVLAERRVLAARGVATVLLKSLDDAVRLAAVRVLGAVGDASCVAVLAELGAEEALGQLNAEGADEAILKGISDVGGRASPRAAEARVALINSAAARGVPHLTPMLLRAAGDAEAKVRAAALKMLGRSGEVSAYPQVVALLGTASCEEAEDAVKLMGRRMTDRQARLVPLQALLLGSQVPVQTQAAALRALAPLGGEDALVRVRERLSSPDVTLRDAAVRALASWPDPAAVPELRKIADAPAASAVHRTLAARALERLASAWTRCAALAYLDCGPAQEAVGKEGVRLRVVTGKPWAFAEQPEGTVAFDPSEVVVEAAGLKPGRAYQLGFTWWDYDGNGRAQSVWAAGQQVVAKTVLPSWKGKQEQAATLTALVPSSAVKEGKATLRFRREAASNALVGEVWLSEASEDGKRLTAPLQTMEEGKRLTAPLQTVEEGKRLTAPLQTVEEGKRLTAPLQTVEEGKRLTAPLQTMDAKPPQPVVKANAGAAKKVLIVTGLEYPGHPWQQTSPALADCLAQDKRLEVSLTEDPRTLALPILNGYDVIVLNYQNHEVPAPEGALANLKRAVEGGKGLVLFHFACGAFIDWPTKTVAPDFGVIAGRVWNPKLRGHDPRGPFRVKIAEAGHPVTKGLVDFDTEDELYTCLDGAAPIRVLASATSKVDQKEYPMAFVLEPGKGRTFHCVLGHDLKALNAAVASLYRRGTAWAAGLE